MKVLVTGAKGQLGCDIMKRLSIAGIESKGVDRDDFDIVDKASVSACINEECPDIVVHCAAYTAVDKAELDHERETCYSINVTGTKNISEACKEVGATVIYFSTDYVFNGMGDKSYEVHDMCAPVNYYGMTKYKGEQAVVASGVNYFIIRISWVFGRHGANFVKTILRLAQTQNEIRVVRDQIGSPTFTEDLATLVVDMALTNKFGLYHATNDGFCSWFDFAREVLRISGKEGINVIPINSEDYPTAAVRPKNSRLSKTSLQNMGFSPLPHWKDAVFRFLTEEGSL